MVNNEGSKLEPSAKIGAKAPQPRMTVGSFGEAYVCGERTGA
jgi:hypothetical protein